MKALTLWQPWASLIAVGAKRHETRSWPAPATILGERIAIHAAVRPVDRRFRSPCALGTLDTQFDRMCCRQLGLDWAAPDDDQLPRRGLPYGVVVATAIVHDCHKAEAVAYRLKTRGTPDDLDDLLSGDFTFGRYAWELRDVRVVEGGSPVRGRQGVWNYDGPLP